MMKRMNQRLHFPRPLSAIVLLIVATVLLVGLLWILVSWMLGSLPVWIGNLELREQEWLEAVRGLFAAWERLLVWTLRIWKIRSVADYRRGWIHWKKISAGNAFPVYAVCAVVRGAGRISGDVSDRSVLLAKDYDGIMNRLLIRRPVMYFWR